MANRKDLIVIESSKKIKRLREILQDLDHEMNIQATLGRLFDIKPVDPDEFTQNGRISWAAIRPPIVDHLINQIAASDKVYVASDSDIEGEVIAWHVQRLAEETGKSVVRVHVKALTHEGIEKALSEPGPIDFKKAEGGVARRVFDNFSQFALDKETIDKKPYLKGVISRLSTPLINSALREPFEPSRFSKSIPLARSDIQVFVPSHMDQDTVGRKIQTLPAPVMDHVEDVEKKITEGMNLSDCMLGFSKALKCEPDEVYESLEELHDNGLITYFRTDSRRMSIDSVNSMKKDLGERGFKSSGLEEVAVPGKQDAHEAITPLGIIGDPFQSLSMMSRPDAVLSLLWRHYAMIGAGYHVKKSISRLSGLAAENEGWRALVRAGARVELTRSEVFVPGMRDPRKWDPEFAPLGVKSGRIAGDGWERLNMSDQQLSVERMTKEGLGRPSTLARLGRGVSKRFFKDGAVNRVGWASMREAKLTAPRLGDPQVARQIEQGLHEGSEGASITDRVYDALTASEWVKPKSESSGPTEKPSKAKARSFSQSFDM